MKKIALLSLLTLLNSCGGEGKASDKVAALKNNPEFKGKKFGELNKETQKKLLGNIIDIAGSPQTRKNTCLTQANGEPAAECKTKVEKCQQKTYPDERTKAKKDLETNIDLMASTMPKECLEMSIDEALILLEDGAKILEFGASGSCNIQTELASKQSVQLTKAMPFFTKYKSCLFIQLLQ